MFPTTKRVARRLAGGLLELVSAAILAVGDRYTKVPAHVFLLMAMFSVAACGTIGGRLYISLGVAAFTLVSLRAREVFERLDREPAPLTDEEIAARYARNPRSETDRSPYRGVRAGKGWE